MSQNLSPEKNVWLLVEKTVHDKCNYKFLFVRITILKSQIIGQATRFPKNGIEFALENSKTKRKITNIYFF